MVSDDYINMYYKCAALKKKSVLKNKRISKSIDLGRKTKKTGMFALIIEMNLYDE